MGKIAFLKIFLKLFVLVSIPSDINDNRRHVHVFSRNKNARQEKSIAKIWIESHGEKKVEIAESTLSAKEKEVLIQTIMDNWDLINQQIDLTFAWVKTELKEIKKNK